MIAIGAAPFVIGREPEPADSAGAFEADEQLSRHHARIWQDGEQLTIEDLGSRNGTFVNDQRIGGPTRLQSGDRIRVGNIKLRLDADDPARTVMRATPADATVARTVLSGAPEVTVARATAPAGATAVASPAEPSGAAPPPPPARKRSMPGRFAALTQTHPGRWLIAIIIFTSVASAFGAPVAGMMHANNPFNDPSSESVQVEHQLGAATGELPGAQVIALLPSPGGPGSAATRARVASVASVIKQERDVSRVQDFYSTRSPGFFSRDGKLTYVAAYLKNISDKERDDAAKRLKSSVGKLPGVQLGGPAIAGEQVGEQSIKDLGLAEALAFPILFAISLWVFRGLVAALMPLFVGTIAIMVTFLALRIVNGFHDLSVFALNVVIGLGLGLAIDYSLFIISRYREELAKVGSDGSGPAGRAALMRAVDTAGRTITYSACTVALALASLCIFPMPFMFSMGLGGAITALAAVITSLIALPAMLAVLGPRINAISPKSWQRAAVRTASNEHQGPWYRLSQAVMRRPVAVALASVAVLIALGIPATGIKFTGVDARDLPTSLSSRQVADDFATRFASDGTSDITAIVRAPGGAAQVDALAARIRRLPGATAQGRPPHALPNGYFTFEVMPKAGPLNGRTIDLVKAIRSQAGPQVLTSGTTSSFLDQKHTISSRLPIVAVLLCVLTALVLFLMTGSVILPIKSLVMNFLSLVAAFGIVVIIFQHGFLHSFLGFKSLGAIDLSQPVLIFAVAFGLASDYGVFLLTRIKEAHDAGMSNTDSVASGLERTGRIVTQAAVLFCVAIGAFATSKVVFLKEVGVGTAFAVIIDATIIRALLVPSLMALLGERNWWAPGPLRRLHRRIGLSEG